MRMFQFLVALVLASPLAWAEQPWSKEGFEKAQRNNEKILLDFYADWCPTCKAQKKSLDQLKSEGQLNGVTVFIVDYDKEEDFKKSLKVRNQSTLISFYGAVETGRETGITSYNDVSEYVKKTLTTLTLKDQLRLMREASASRIPTDKMEIMTAALKNLKMQKLEEKTLKVGQTFPDFNLKDVHGKSVNLKSLKKKGSVIISFYRGSWCPYCNAQLSAFQQHLSDFQEKGAQLIAITPEKPNLSLSLAENKKIEFSILNDKDNKFAKKVGLVFGVSKELREIYKQNGIDLEKSQGNSDWNLPIPATFVISKSGKIIYSFVDVDYTNRASPEDILQALEKNEKAK